MSAILNSPAVSSPDSHVDVVYARLRTAIRTREIKPGDRLREADLVEKFGFSRTPVREALHRLRADGLIEPSSSRGFVVVELTLNRVMELYAMREELAGISARLAAAQASAMEIQYLRGLVARQEKATEAIEASAINHDLRTAITTAAHNEFLARMANTLNDALDLLGSTIYTMPGRIDSSLAENKATVEAIASRDCAAAEEAARLHVRTAATYRIQMMFGRSRA